VADVTIHLVLRAKSLKEDSTPIVGEFDERGGTIGRSDSNTMTLPDPERHVSRLQAEVSFAAGAFSLRNVGSSNPIIVNGRPLTPGEAVRLQHRDQLTIGGYALHVDLQSLSVRSSAARTPAVNVRTVIGASAGEERTGPPRVGVAAAAAASASVDPFADLLGGAAPAGVVDPFADLLVPGAPAPRPAAPPQRREPHLPPAPAIAQAAARLPDDFDPFAESTAPSALAGASSPSASPVHDVLGPAAAGPSLDSVFGLSGGSAGQGRTDPLEDFLAPLPSGGDAASGPSANDAFAFLRGGNAAPVGPAASDHISDLQAAFNPPPVREAKPFSAPAVSIAPSVLAVPPVAVVPPAAAREHLSPAGGADALWAAFCEGAQLSSAARVTVTPELMQMIGATLRHAVEGTVQLSAARTMIKQELHVPVTVIKAKGNNPLKFAPDATAALTQMLQPPMRGFMAAPEAMQDAMTDLLAHSLGTMEGTRAALHGMLRRFEPAQLEAQLSSGGVLDKLLPMNRRARLWELYLQHFGRIGESAREDFNELFGKAFAQAYEAHADRVAASRRGTR
jgi:type VI secretion system FHA domain protein